MTLLAQVLTCLLTAGSPQSAPDSQPQAAATKPTDSGGQAVPPPVPWFSLLTSGLVAAVVVEWLRTRKEKGLIRIRAWAEWAGATSPVVITNARYVYLEDHPDALGTLLPIEQDAALGKLADECRALEATLRKHLFMVLACEWDGRLTDEAERLTATCCREDWDPEETNGDEYWKRKYQADAEKLKKELEESGATVSIK